MNQKTLFHLNEIKVILLLLLLGFMCLASYISDSMGKLIVCTPPPTTTICSGHGGGGGESPTTRFSRRGGQAGPHLLEGGCWEREGT